MPQATQTIGAEDQKIRREDIEAKIQEIQDSITGTAERSKLSVLSVGVTITLVGLLLAYLFGRRSGKQKKTVLEVKRL